jgi:serine/threonine-protein kinase RsbW
MSDNGWISTREMLIPSDATSAKQVVDELLALLGQHRWLEHDLFSVHLAVEEAIVNAIKHGNRYNVDKKVSILYRISDTHVRIEIADEGNGFDPSSVPDPTDDENLERSSGRGLMLMHSFMSSVQYNRKGNRVVMEKRRADAP